MTTNARRVITLLEDECRGHARRLTSREIGARLGMAPKQVVDAVHELRNEHRKPIGSEPGRSAGGFWLIVDKAEAEATHDKLYGKAMATLKTCRALREHFRLDPPRLLDVLRN